MADLNDFIYTDNIDDVMAVYINRLLGATMRSEYKNVQTLTADRTLGDADTPIQRLDCGAADRVVKAPTQDAVNNHPFFVVNASAVSRTLTVKNNAGSSVLAVLLQGQACLMLPAGDGTYMVVLLGNLYARVWAGKTTAPTTGDDSADGYVLGDRWIDETNNKEYVALDVTVGAAVWTETTGSGTTDLIGRKRLSLVSATPVTTAEQTAKTTIYWTDGNTNLSVAVPATTNTPFDVFYDVSDAALSTTNWTNDTTRATALVYNTSGYLAKSGDTDKIYLGTGRTTGVSGQTEDSLTKRFLWNYYNRLPRALAKFESTNSWTTTTTTWHSANGSTANRVEIVTGVAESPLSLEVMGMSSHSVANTYAFMGIGEDTATANSAATQGTVYLMTNAVNYIMPTSAKLVKYPTIGYHYYQWVQITQAATATFYSNDGGGLRQAGITGTISG